MENTHSNNIQAWYNAYIDAAKKVAPELHSRHDIQWIVHDTRKDNMTVRCIYNTNYKGKESHPEYSSLLEALEKQDQGLPFPLEGFLPWYGSQVGDSVNVSYGKEYKISISDLPVELQTEREQLLSRNEGLKQTRELIKKLQATFMDPDLQPEFFESKDNIADLNERMISYVQEKLSMLKEIETLIIETRPASFRENLKQYEDKVLKYLGIPIDTSDRPLSKEDRAPGRKVWVSRNWWW